MLLLVMILLQVLWLALTWLTGAASNWGKIPILLVYSVVVGMVVFCAPFDFGSKIGQVKEYLAQNENRLLAALCLVVLGIGVVYANYQRVWPDEESSFRVSRIVAEKGVTELFVQYASHSWLGSQHPPLMIVVYGLVMSIFGVNLLVPRLVCLVFAIATVPIMYFLGRELYDRDTGIAATLLLLSFPVFFRLGSTAMTDVPVTFFFSLAMLLFLRLLRQPTCRLAIAASIVIIAGVLSKYTMVLIYPVLFSYFVTNSSVRRLNLYLAIIFLVPVCGVAAWLVYAYHIGVLWTQVETLASYVTVVIRTDIGKQFLLESLVTRLPSAVGVYNLPLLLLGGLHALRRKSQSDWFVVLWSVTVFLLLMVTLPDYRYFMPAFPALALLMARGLERLPKNAGQAVTLALLYCGGALYLFVDWYRVQHLFLP